MRLNASRARNADPTAGFDLSATSSKRQDRHDRLIPMINIVFLLLTFFLVTGTFRAANTLAIDPPLARSDGALDADSRILYIDRTGSLAFGNERMTPEKIVAVIRDWLAKHPDGKLQIKADKALHAGTILPLLHELQQVGIKSVRLIVTKREDRK